MKKILLAVVAVLLMVSCNSNQNPVGSGYNTVTQTAVAATVPNQNEISEYKKGHVVSVGRYGSAFNVCTAYYGEFNGHTWYVFYDNLAAPAVVHDPLCACGGGK